MVSIEIAYGGRPTLVEVEPSPDFPEPPHKVLRAVDIGTGVELVDTGMMEDAYRWTIDRDIQLKQKEAKT